MAACEVAIFPNSFNAATGDRLAGLGVAVRLLYSLGKCWNG